MGEASNRAKLKYNKKTYDTYAVKLHKEREADIIAKIDKLVKEGLTKSDAVKRLLRGAE